MSLLLVLSVSFIAAVSSQACVPANTCFEDISNGFGRNSLMWTCSNGAVSKKSYEGVTDCSSSARLTTLTDALHDGVDAHTSSGAVGLDYLQGSECPTLTGSPDRYGNVEACTDYMVIRRYGNEAHTGSDGQVLPFLDIGDNCVNKGTQLYSTFVMPKGCMNLFSTGSNLLYCNGTHLGWTQYDADNCGGDIRIAQTDVFEVDTCGLFRDITHVEACQPAGSAHCVQEWYYYFEEICGCTTECSDIYSAVATPTTSPAPTTSTTLPPSTTTMATNTNAGSPSTTSNTNAGSSSTTDTNTNSGTTTTPAPASGPPSGNPSGATPTETPTAGSNMQICAFSLMIVFAMLLVIF